MEVCYKVYLEEDPTSVMSVLTTPVTNSAAFSARSSTYDSDKNNENRSLSANIARNSGTLRISVGNFMVAL